MATRPKIECLSTSATLVDPRDSHRFNVSSFATVGTKEIECLTATSPPLVDLGAEITTDEDSFEGRMEEPDPSEIEVMDLTGDEIGEDGRHEHDPAVVLAPEGHSFDNTEVMYEYEVINLEDPTSVVKLVERPNTQGIILVEDLEEKVSESLHSENATIVDSIVVPVPSAPIPAPIVENEDQNFFKTPKAIPRPRGRKPQEKSESQAEKIAKETIRLANEEKRELARASIRADLYHTKDLVDSQWKLNEGLSAQIITKQKEIEEYEKNDGPAMGKVLEKLNAIINTFPDPVSPDQQDPETVKLLEFCNSILNS